MLLRKISIFNPIFVKFSLNWKWKLFYWFFSKRKFENFVGCEEKEKFPKIELYFPRWWFFSNLFRLFVCPVCFENILWSDDFKLKNVFLFSQRNIWKVIVCGWLLFGYFVFDLISKHNNSQNSRFQKFKQLPDRKCFFLSGNTAESLCPVIIMTDNNDNNTAGLLCPKILNRVLSLLSSSFGYYRRLLACVL